jgi:oxygen-dependent protoporphyrinogen oxidase
MSSVAIIGAGITGLAAGFRLHQRGIPVTLYEASDRWGGVIQSIRQDGYLAEFGPNTVLETSPKIGSLIKDAGLEGDRLYTDPAADKRFLVRDRRPVQMPGSPPAFFACPLFSWKAKARLLLEPFIRRAAPDVEENLADFVVRRLGREFLDYAINPFVAGVYAGDPARLSVKEAFPKLHAVEQRYGSLILGQFLGARERKRRGEVSKQNAPKLSFAEGLQVLTDRLAGHLHDRMHLNTPVQRIRQTARAWQVERTEEDGLKTCEHAAVLLAVPTHRFPSVEFLPGTAIDLGPLKEIRYPPVTSIVLGFRRQDVAHPLDGFGMLVPQIEGFSILGTIFSSSLFPNRAPAGHVTLTTYAGGTRNPELAFAEPADLVATTVKDLQVLLGVRGSPTFQHCRLYPQAIPQYDVGYGRFRQLMTEAETRAPGLFFGGHYRDGISLGDSMVSGQDAAVRMAGFLKQ